MTVRINFCTMDSPIGRLHLAHSGSGLAAIELPREKTKNDRASFEKRLRRRFGDGIELVEHGRALDSVLNWLKKYFANPAATTNYRGPYDFGGTEFQKMVWMQLLKIPAGSTKSYKQVALDTGRPAAVRAVGTACGANPVPVVVPCHRVVAVGGIGGYGGGPELKRRLLAAEGVDPD